MQEQYTVPGFMPANGRTLRPDAFQTIPLLNDAERRIVLVAQAIQGTNHKGAR